MAISAQLVFGPSSSIIVICSSDGVHRIVLDRDGNPIELPDEDTPIPTCSICFSLNAMGSVVVPATTPELFAPLATRIAYTNPDDAVEDRQPFVRCCLDPPRLV